MYFGGLNLAKSRLQGAPKNLSNVTYHFNWLHLTVAYRNKY